MANEGIFTMVTGRKGDGGEPAAEPRSIEL